jgi:hypothetical protein
MPSALEIAIVQNDRHVNYQADYMDLFWPTDDLWPTVASKLSVLKISTQMILRGNDGILQTIISSLKQRNIKMSAELGVPIYRKNWLYPDLPITSAWVSSQGSLRTGKCEEARPEDAHEG